MIAKVDVDEVDIPKVEIGQRAEVFLLGFPSESFPGTVIEIGGEGVLKSGLIAVEVEIRLEGGNPKLKPGLSAEADIFIGGKDK